MIHSHEQKAPSTPVGETQLPIQMSFSNPPFIGYSSC